MFKFEINNKSVRTFLASAFTDWLFLILAIIALKYGQPLGHVSTFFALLTLIGSSINILISIYWSVKAYFYYKDLIDILLRYYNLYKDLVDQVKIHTEFANQIIYRLDQANGGYSNKDVTSLINNYKEDTKDLK